MANTYISRTFGTPTNANIWTYSVWIKRSQLGADQCFLAAGTGATDRTEISFSGSDYIAVYRNIGGSTAGVETSELYRDTSGWYNLVFKNDNGTMTIYVNGETVTQNTSSLGTNRINQASVVHQIGEIVATGNPFNGSMSYVAFVDGQALTPSTFGETDSVTGQWKIKTSIVPGGTGFGNNGFLILKNGNTITDQSSNSNNWALSSGTLTDTKDCPDNVFATMNPLDNYYPNFNLAYGNTSVGAGNGPRTYLLATMGLAPTGKYYWEIKLQGQSNGASSNSVLFGISQKSTDSTTEDLTDGVASSTVIDGSGRVYVEGSLAGTFGSSYEPSTVMCLAYDAVNNKMYFGKDGTWLNSGDPTSGSTGTGAFTPTATNGAYNNIYIPCWGVNYNSGYSVAFNFGNGSFNTSAVSSAGTNASSNGIFEHDVPTGYTALSTKGLNL